ncbi:MAG: P-loop NTPase fold protein [Xenococcaceae cyanobacterium]
MTNSASPLEALNAAIKKHNLFKKPAVVRNQDIWGKGFPDLTTLNVHASNAVLQAIKQVSYGGDVTSIAIVAEQGVGKSHVISRIRHRLQAEGGALFVYASASQFSDLDRIKYQFLQTFADSFRQVGSQGVMQWQELAVAMFNQATNKSFSPQYIIQKFPAWLKKYNNLMDVLINTVLQCKPHIGNPDIVRAIFWTLSQSHAPFAIKWLAGNDLADAKATAMELPNPGIEVKNLKAFDTVGQILSLISDYSTLLICFDQLEGLEINESGYTKAQVVASELVSNLFESLNLATHSKGVVILTVMLPDTWKLKIKVLPGGVPVRVSPSNPIDLKHLDSELTVELVKLWLTEFYGSRNLVPPHPLYPFDENQLKRLGREKPPVRKVLEWCGENFVSGKPLVDPVESAYENELAELENSLEKYLENKKIIADAMRLSFSTVIGKTIEKVTIENIEDINPKSSNRGYIDFKIVGKEDGKTVKIGVGIIQQSGGKGVGAGLKRLIDYQKYDLTRGCLVRSKTVKANTKGQEYLDKLLSAELGGEWVKLTGEDIKPLLSILFVYSAREDYELSEEQIFDFLAKKKLAADNYLIREILSNPAGQIPEGLVDEDNLDDNDQMIPDTTNDADDIDIDSLSNKSLTQVG